MKKEDQDTVADFLVRKAPTDLVEGLNVLQKLELPIHDKYSFECQLEKISEQSDDKSRLVVETIIGHFGSQDFPILSLENAFDKFWDKFRPLPLPIPFPRPIFPFPGPTLPPELPDRGGDEPQICEVYDEAFGSGTLASSCACRSYAEARRAGYNHLQAVLIGHSSGQRARATGRCDA